CRRLCARCISSRMRGPERRCGGSPWLPLGPRRTGLLTFLETKGTETRTGSGAWQAPTGPVSVFPAVSDSPDLPPLPRCDKSYHLGFPRGWMRYSMADGRQHHRSAAITRTATRKLALLFNGHPPDGQHGQLEAVAACLFDNLGRTVSYKRLLTAIGRKSDN